jgi:cell division protein FtsZ
MMGTGEASGEKRALSAAEAAISNPLIDDASMKGARGLLISITGGRDLTLYEVDEAATRIREEVDQDANIIVGATFDEQLEGIIRVAVVATGIDQSNMSATAPRAPAQPAAPEARLAELAHKLRADQQRLSERVERSDSRGPINVQSSHPAAHAAAGHMQPPHAGHMASSHAPASHAPAHATKPDLIDSAARAAVAAAVMPITSVEEVTIRPMQPKPSLFLEPTPPAEQPIPEPAPTAFIPPAPERVVRPARMPRIDELPIPAQNELRAKRGEAPEADHPEKRRMGLLQRLASVGLGRREDEEDLGPGAARQTRPMQQRAPEPPRAPAPRPVANRPEPRMPEPARMPDPVSEYAKRPTHQGLDQHGRQAPVHNSSEDDQLEIPAFLRRQAK